MKDYSLASDEFLSQQRLLVIAPHADDESFGCAGTMARIKKLGGQVFVVVVSVGDLQHYGDEEQYQFVTGEERKAELGRVMELLSVDDHDILFEQNELHERLDRVPRRQLIELLERDGRLAMDRLHPTMVALPAISYNQDHEAIFRAAHTACRPGLPKRKAFLPFLHERKPGVPPMFQIIFQRFFRNTGNPYLQTCSPVIGDPELQRVHLFPVFTEKLIAQYL